MSNLLSDKFHLEKIQYIFRFEIPWLMFALFFVFYSGIGLYILNGIMAVFIPYLLFVLFRLKRWGWISCLSVFVILPLLHQLLGSPFLDLPDYPAYLPLFFFLLFNFFLKFVIRDWIEDINARIERSTNRN
ncbi:MAG: hypothetical protein CVV24_05625 [Ignavibacteriae bacterium HGW-Ignavibacteriae-3]|nr:MAG: hypothetical protein CVV24_05625 [Ignavibacteriae bacterium HGW-Ignavibacteriae-3]